jgi:hypothetical protein
MGFEHEISCNRILSHTTTPFIPFVIEGANITLIKYMHIYGFEAHRNIKNMNKNDFCF